MSSKPNKKLAPNSKNRVRMRDIAQSLGVSLSTVSRALNSESKSKISPDVVAQICRKAKELGYIGDATASNLRRQKTSTIGIVVPDILNPVFPPIIKGAQQYLSKHGYVTFIVYSENDQDVATAEIQRLIARRVDGLIVTSAFLQDKSVKFCVEQGTPLVLVNRSISDSKRIHQVLADDADGVRLAIEHLYSLNHRHLIHLAGPLDILQGQQRLEGFIHHCSQKGIEHTVIQMNSFSVEAGEDGARQILDKNIPGSAIVAGNDLMAIGAIKALRERGISVPDQMSVLGFNNMPLSDMLNPPLTTVSIPHAHLGEQAAQLIIDEIASPGGPIKTILLAPTLIVRESTATIELTS